VVQKTCVVVRSSTSIVLHGHVQFQRGDIVEAEQPMVELDASYILLGRNQRLLQRQD